jgi:hypothetical protein
VFYIHKYEIIIPININVMLFMADVRGSVYVSWLARRDSTYLRHLHSAGPTSTYLKHSFKSVECPCNEPLAHLTRNFSIGKLVAIGRFPCEMPQACLTPNAHSGVRSLSATKKHHTRWCLIVAALSGCTSQLFIIIII